VSTTVPFLLCLFPKTSVVCSGCLCGARAFGCLRRSSADQSNLFFLFFLDCVLSGQPNSVAFFFRHSPRQSFSFYWDVWSFFITGLGPPQDIPKILTRCCTPLPFTRGEMRNSFPVRWHGGVRFTQFLIASRAPFGVSPREHPASGAG